MRNSILLFIIVLLLPSSINAQFSRQPRIEITPSIGIFRLSNDNFSDFYESRIVYPLGVSIDYAFNPTFHLNIRGKYFKKSSTFSDENSNGDVDLVWKQTWFGIGIQRLTISFTGDSRSFFGFGFAFFSLDENEDGYLLARTNATTKNPKGFYLSGGVDRNISDKIRLRFEIELTSAGVGDGFGIETQSFGGIFGGLGLNLNLF